MEVKNNPLEITIKTIDTKDDDIVKLTSPDLEKLLEVADRVGQYLGMLPGEAAEMLRENLGVNHYEIRPEGNFGMWLSRKSEGSYLLNIDNRNARGYKPMTDRLHEAVEQALKTKENK